MSGDLQMDYVQNGGLQQSPQDVKLPRLPADLPAAFTHDPERGPLFDKLALQMYALGFGRLCRQMPPASAAPAGHEYSDVLGPFVELMLAELRANAGKGDRPGWLSMSREDAVLEVYYHTAKLQRAIRDRDAVLIREHAADVANMAMMALDVCGGLPSPVAQPLWCINIQGPDDVIPMPSHAAALIRANDLNVEFGRRRHHEYDPVLRAVVIEWPHSAASHAEGLAKLSAAA